MSAGEGLRTLRKEMGKSIRVVAGLAGVSYGNLCEIERGKQSPYIYTVKNIAEATGMDLHRLAHYCFDLPEPQPQELMDEELLQVLRLIASLPKDERSRIIGKILGYMDREMEGSGETAWEPQNTGHG